MVEGKKGTTFKTPKQDTPPPQKTGKGKMVFILCILIAHAYPLSE